MAESGLKKALPGRLSYPLGVTSPRAEQCWTAMWIHSLRIGWRETSLKIGNQHVIFKYVIGKNMKKTQQNPILWLCRFAAVAFGQRIPLDRRPAQLNVANVQSTAQRHRASGIRDGMGRSLSQHDPHSTVTTVCYVTTFFPWGKIAVFEMLKSLWARFSQ